MVAVGDGVLLVGRSCWSKAPRVPLKKGRKTMKIESTRSNFGSSIQAESVKQQPQPTFGSTMKLEEAGSSASFRMGEISDMKMVVKHKDLKEIVEAIKQNFDKAATDGDQVSEMLEISNGTF